MPALPFNTALSVLRLTFNASAAAVTERPRGSRQSSRSTSPGCGGLCINIGGTSVDRKSTRLNSSHVRISYAVFCLKKKNRHVTTKHIIRNTATTRHHHNSPHLILFIHTISFIH